MKRQVVLTRKELNEYIDKQADTIIEKMLKNKNRISENRERLKTEERLTDRICESIKQQMGLKKSVKLNVNETIEYDDYGSISDALAQCGWAYSDCYDVHNRDTGQQGIRYIIEPYPNNLEGIKPMDVEEMKQKMTELIGEENIFFSEGQHRYASEIKNLSMVVVE